MKYKRIILIIAVIFGLSLCAYKLLDYPRKSNAQNKFVHFSFDDIESVFYDIIKNQDQYASVFDNPFLNQLQEYHKAYNAKFTLYTYEKTNNYRIEDFPIKYKTEFINNSDWLKLGFHWIEPEFSKDITCTEFEESYSIFNNAVANFAGLNSLAHTLRLHYFYGPDSLLKIVNHGGGGYSLLCADSKNRKSYDLIESETDRLWIHRYIVKNNNKYFTTDIRLEHHPVIIHELKLKQDCDTLVIFSHEWALGPQSLRDFASRIVHNHTIQINALNHINLRIAIKWLYDNNYTFTFFE